MKSMLKGDGNAPSEQWQEAQPIAFVLSAIPAVFAVIRYFRQLPAEDMDADVK